MLIVYRLLINLILIISPIIIFYRLLKKKEDIKRFWEKFCFFSLKRNKGKLIWFHGASVGEIQSIVPLLEKIEKNKQFNKILITSNTLSSSKIIEKLKLKKTIHQFYPIDTNILSRKFLNYWKPSCAFFIDSEIWPNMLFNLEKKNIPTILINGRITKKTFLRWKLFSGLAKKVFSKFSLMLCSNKETRFYLKKLGAKNVKLIGNLKYSQSENEQINVSNKFKKFIKSKKIWCASSTHYNEENFCAITHTELKKKFNDLVTIIIPRHIDRVPFIENELKKMNLITHIYSSNQRINKNTDILIVDSYGKTKSIYSSCKNVFLGGSIINRGGQNPLEAVRYGCSVIHGPHISNFKEIYNFLKINKISTKITTQKKMIVSLKKLFRNKTGSKKIQKKLKLIGKKILNLTFKEINIVLKK